MKILLDVITSTYSFFGEKKAYFSFSENQKTNVFSFIDSGGVFGDKKRYFLDSEDFARKTKCLLITSGLGEDQAQIIGKTELGDGHVVFGSQQIQEFMTGISVLYSEDDFPLIYFPGSLNKTEASRFNKIFRTEEMDNDDLMELSVFALKDLEKNSMLPVAIYKVADRIQIKTLYGEHTDLPIGSLPINASDNKITINKNIFIGGIQVSGITINYPNKDFANKHLKILATESRENAEERHEEGFIETKKPTALWDSGITSQVYVKGFINGVPLDFSECDAEINSNELILLTPGSCKNFIQFNFENPKVAIDGTSNAFIISDNQETVIRISAKRKEFHKAIADSQSVRSAANRSANVGPFVASTISDEPIRLEFQKNQLIFFKDGNLERLAISALEKPCLELKENKSFLKVGDFHISSQLPMLEGIYSSFLASSELEKVKTDCLEYVPSIVGLEGKYFIYNIFGKLAEAHLIMSSALSMPPSGQTALLENEYEQNIFLAFMIENASMLARSIETVANYLPAFATGRDREFIEKIQVSETLNLRNIESAYQRALSLSNGLASHLYKIDNYVSRLTSMRKALTKEAGWNNYLPLGVSAAASLITPFALVGAAQQGISMLSRNDAQKNMENDVFVDSFEKCSQEWDYIIHSLLPAIIYRMSQEIYPIRLSISATVLSAYEKSDNEIKAKIEEMVSHRFARLKTFETFPSTNQNNYSRDEIVKFLFDLQKKSEAFGLRYF